MKLPLDGIRVVEWAMWLQGPAAGLMLGDMGADVIKIEQRVTGDQLRGLHFDPVGRDVAIGAGRYLWFEAYNRNKRGIAVDLTKKEGREIVCRLVERADVFLQNFRQGVAERLEMDYRSLARRNPKLIYVSCSGFGPKGPMSHQAAYDYLALAYSGIMAAEPGPVRVPGRGLADQMGAIMAAYGTLLAVVARERLGVGQEIDVSLLGSMIWLQFMGMSAAVTLGHAIGRPREDGPNPLWCHYRCADDRWLVLGLVQADRYWSDFCRVMGIENLENDPRFENMAARTQHRAELVAILDELFASKPRDEWMSQLRAADLIATPVNAPLDLVNDPQVVANDYIAEYDHPALDAKIKMVGIPVQLSKTPGAIRLPAPEFGQHTEEVLLEVGYNWDEIGKLKEDEVI